MLVGGNEDSPHTLLGDTGVTRSSSSVLWMVATFCSAATMLRCGFILDRLGPMKALSGTAVLLGLSLGALSFSSSGAANLASATAKGKLKVWGIVPNGVRGAAGMFAKSTASGGGR